MNSNTLSKILIFAAGATIGSAVTWKLLNAKYAQRAEQEIKEIKEYYKGKYEPEKEEEVTTKPEPQNDQTSFDFTKEEKAEYLNLAQNYTSEKGGSKSMVVGTPPYVIHPDEFGTLDDYDTMSLVYYADEVLTDDDDNLIEDIENTVGEDFASHFEEYEDDPDTVYIRNERLRTDYEICMDTRTFSEATTPIYTNPKDDE